MPLLPGDEYRPAWPFRNADAGTIIPSALRRVPALPYVRERVELPDGDFVDLDWSRVGAGRTALLCHGLEGNSERPYMRGMARALNAAGWDVAALNLRGCSAEPNRLARFYHNGATDDLRAVVAHLDAPTLALVGFSLGGNLILNYLGEEPATVPDRVAAAIAVSAPVDLAGTAARLVAPRNRIYHDRFLRKLRRKIRAKAAARPGLVDPAGLARVRTLIDFDDLYTAPLHGFADAADYYERCSSGARLPAIRVPTLLLTAADDPLLGAGCFPAEAAGSSAAFHLLVTRWGGHNGFRAPGGVYWSERQAVRFLDRVAPAAADLSNSAP
ncbi:alpha/beta fold hydrolase [bacterium]|nr:alpha/beta fold hydrolase [bacterium]